MIYIGCLKGTAVGIGFILEIKGISTPLEEKNYRYYSLGGATSLTVLAVVSDRVYRSRKKFVPLTNWLIVTFLYELALLITSFIIEVKETPWTSFNHGYMYNSL